MPNSSESWHNWPPNMPEFPEIHIFDLRTSAPCVCPCDQFEALRDWKVAETKPGASPDVETKTSLRAEMEKLVDGQPTQFGAIEKSKNIANILVLRAIDTALRWGINHTLASFRTETKLQPLPFGQVRKFLDIAELDDSLRRPDTKRRAFLMSSDGSRCEEILDSMLSAGALHLRADQGSVGWCGYQYLFLEMPVDGTFNYDPPHRVHNEARCLYCGPAPKPEILACSVVDCLRRCSVFRCALLIL